MNLPTWLKKLLKIKDNEGAEDRAKADDVDDFSGPPDSDPANPGRVNRRVNDVNGVVVIALAGALIYSLTWNLKQKDHVEKQVIFVQFSDDAKRDFAFMDPRESAVDRAQKFSEVLGEEYIRYYNELINDQAEMKRRWNEGGWIWAHSAPSNFATFQTIAAAAWKVLDQTKVGQKPKDIHCASLGDGALSCSFTTVQVDASGKERGTQMRWQTSIGYQWLTTMPAAQADKNKAGWIVTSYEPTVAN
jgi:hypothetical protein